MAVEKPEEVEEKAEPLDSTQIISEVYRSLDKQIEKLDELPSIAQTKTSDLLRLLFSKADIFRDPPRMLEFIVLSSSLSMEIGLAFQTVLEVELAKEHVNNNSQTVMPMPQPMMQQVERPNPNVIVQSTPPKGGGWADYFGVRRWATAIEKIYQNQPAQQQPAITTSKVMKVLEYGQELLAEWNNTFDFYEKGIDGLNIFGDPETFERQHKLLTFHLVKLCNIICVFSKTIAEYRMERFGDRKVGVTAGLMWLEAAKAGAAGAYRGPPISIDPSSLAMRDRVR